MHHFLRVLIFSVFEVWNEWQKGDKGRDLKILLHIQPIFLIHSSTFGKWINRRIRWMVEQRTKNIFFKLKMFLNKHDGQNDWNLRRALWRKTFLSRKWVSNSNYIKWNGDWNGPEFHPKLKLMAPEYRLIIVTLNYDLILPNYVGSNAKIIINKIVLTG